MDWTGASSQPGSPDCTVGQDRDSPVTSSAVAVLVLALLTPDRQVAAAEPDCPW